MSPAFAAAVKKVEIVQHFSPQQNSWSWASPTVLVKMLAVVLAMASVVVVVVVMVVVASVVVVVGMVVVVVAVVVVSVVVVVGMLVVVHTTWESQTQCPPSHFIALQVAGVSPWKQHSGLSSVLE